MSRYLHTTHKDIAWFKQANELNQLEMKPPFQRNPVWTSKQKSFLIDTILNGYPIPEIYMQDITNEKGEKLYTIVDGQQRITACLDFIYGEFIIDAKDSPTFGGLSFDDLKVDQKKLIYSYQFVIRLLPEIPDSEIREIFQRLNRNNVALNPQELRQATYWGPFIETMNRLAEMEVWNKLNIFSPNDVKRMLDVEFISELTIALLHGIQNKKLTLDKYYTLYEEEFHEMQSVQDTFSYVLREIISILPEIANSRWSKKTDFYTLFLILAKYQLVFPLSQEKRNKLNSILTEFAQNVDLFVKVEKEAGASDHFSNEVKQYALNLRASSDLGARRNRGEALEKVITSIIS